MACCLLLNAAELSDSGCQGLSPVVCCLHSFPTLGSGLSSACWQPSCCLFTDDSHEFSFLPPPPPSLVSFQQPLLPPLCASFQFCCLLCVFFFCTGGSVCPGGLCWFIPRVAERYRMMLGSHLFGLLKVSQACLELAASGASGSHVGVVAYLFSQYIMVWRS
jgi:hypothetical protein